MSKNGGRVRGNRYEESFNQGVVQGGPAQRSRLQGCGGALDTGRQHGAPVAAEEQGVAGLEGGAGGR